MSKAEVKNKYNSNPFTLAFEALGKFFENNLAWAAVLIGLVLFGFFMQFLGNIIPLIIGAETSSQTTAATSSGSNDISVVAVVAISLIVLAFGSIFAMLAIAVSAFIAGLYSYIALESLKGNTVSASEGFSRTAKRLWPLFGAQLLAIVKIIGWTFLFIIPGIVAAYRFKLIPYVVMNEEEKKIRKIHDRTKILVKKRLWEVFGIDFVASIVPFIGNLVGYSGKAALYNQMQIATDTKTEKPKIHWLNYLGLIIFGSVALIIGFFAVLIAILVSVN
jgi:hypothetical protein